MAVPWPDHAASDHTRLTAWTDIPPSASHGRAVAEPLVIPGTLAYVPTGLDLSAWGWLHDGPVHERYPLPGALSLLAAEVLRIVTPWWQDPLRFPTGALVNRQVGVGYHRDQTQPAPSVDVTLILRQPGSTGGVLVFPDLGVSLACADGWVAVYRGAEEWHGVTEPSPGRASVVFYSPL